MPTHTDWQVNTINPIICKAVCELAQANGWCGSMFSDPNYAYRYFCINCIDGELEGNNRIRSIEKRPVITIDDAIRIISNGPPKIMDFNIDGHKIIINEKGVTIGDLFISNRRVESIYDAYMILRHL